MVSKNNFLSILYYIIYIVSNLSMLFWFGQLKYFLPPEMSGPIVTAALFQTKKLVEAIGITVRKNVLRRNVGRSMRT